MKSSMSVKLMLIQIYIFPTEMSQSF